MERQEIMRITGIIRRIDGLGRIVIPKEIRRTYGITDGSPIEIFTTDNGIVLKKYQTEDELKNLANVLGEAVESSIDDLDDEKFHQIRKRIGEIRRILE